MVRYSVNQRGLPAGNPLANLLVIVAGALVVAASVVLGFLAFVVLASIILVIAAIVGVRVWWLSRKLKKQAPQEQTEAQGHDVIEGEYHVVVEDREEPR